VFLTHFWHVWMRLRAGWLAIWFS